MQAWIPNTPLQNGQYIIKKVIGAGGFGETYLALDTEENRLVVIKTLNREQQEKPDFAKRQKKFRKEALDLSKCYHPHVVRVYDNFVEDGLWAIVMEHINGYNLRAYISENGWLSETEALRYIDQIGQALECIHERGLLHRDIKPSNILLRPKTNEAVLIDFGLAREFKPGNIRSMTEVKTEGYAPIEQYQRHGHFGYYTDVYALAATLYTLLTTRVPIPSNYRAEYDVLLPPPKKYNQQISDRVNAAIIKGMELESINRPQTIREFRELLGLSVEPVANIPTPVLVEPVADIPTPVLVEPVADIPTPPPVYYPPVPVQQRQQQSISRPERKSYSSFLSKLRQIFTGQNSTSQSVNKQLKLKSSSGMDYRKLRDLLAARKWKEADKETLRVILAVAQREQQGWLNTSSIDNFSCEDLRIIDQLWVKYSNGKFGFSVQRKIYQGLGGTRNYDKKIWEAFGDKVGWRRGGQWFYYQDITFDSKTQKVQFGNFPRMYNKKYMYILVYMLIFSRVETCKL